MKACVSLFESSSCLLIAKNRLNFIYLLTSCQNDVEQLDCHQENLVYYLMTAKYGGCHENMYLDIKENKASLLSTDSLTPLLCQLRVLLDCQTNQNYSVLFNNLNAPLDDLI
jgi:hypothetical protein